MTQIDNSNADLYTEQTDVDIVHDKHNPLFLANENLTWAGGTSTFYE